MRRGKDKENLDSCERICGFSFAEGCFLGSIRSLWGSSDRISLGYYFYIVAGFFRFDSIIKTSYLIIFTVAFTIAFSGCIFRNSPQFSPQFLAQQLNPVFRCSKITSRTLCYSLRPTVFIAALLVCADILLCTFLCTWGNVHVVLLCGLA